jgi:hypothetical protein
MPEKHGGQYPPGLKELGPHGLQCLDAGLARGYAGNMNITYHPQREAGNYSLLMENSSWFKKTSKSFYTDTESFTNRLLAGRLPQKTVLLEMHHPSCDPSQIASSSRKVRRIRAMCNTFTKIHNCAAPVASWKTDFNIRPMGRR